MKDGYPGNSGIKAVAQALNLSASTVSRALNGVYGVNPATRKLVQETAQAMGYVAHLGAKQLVGKSSNLIGVFIPHFGIEASMGFVNMFNPLQTALQSYGKDAIFFSIPLFDYPEQRLKECMNSRSLEGCIIFPAFTESHPIMQEALSMQIPCVNFEDVSGPRCSSVISNDREGGRLAGTMLRQEGHRVIGYINGPPHHRVCIERYEGFLAVLNEEGIKRDESLIVVGDFSGASGARAAIELWKANPDMTAIFCANDLMAMGAIMELTRLGVAVPDQVSIVGYDDDSFTPYTSPPLTTVRHPKAAISVKAVELLMELLEGSEGRREAISPELIVRESVAKLLDS